MGREQCWMLSGLLLRQAVCSRDSRTARPALLEPGGGLAKGGSLPKHSRAQKPCKEQPCLAPSLSAPTPALPQRSAEMPGTCSNLHKQAIVPKAHDSWGQLECKCAALNKPPRPATGPLNHRLQGKDIGTGYAGSIPAGDLLAPNTTKVPAGSCFLSSKH